MNLNEIFREQQLLTFEGHKVKGQDQIAKHFCKRTTRHLQ